MRKLGMLLVVFSMVSPAAFATEAALKHVPNAQEVGTGRLSMVFWDVYYATLYAPGGKWDPEASYALKIHYFREIEGSDIADRTVEEIRKQGFGDEEKLAEWQAQLRNIFPLVTKGSQLTAVAEPGKPTRFYFNDKPIGSIADEKFGSYFFAIWLGEKTSEPALRKKLLGFS